MRRCDVQLTSAAKIKISIMQMTVGMADAAMIDREQYFGARGIGCVGHQGFQRSAIRNEGLTFHVLFLPAGHLAAISSERDSNGFASGAIAGV
jgi:hypothetical protein